MIISEKVRENNKKSCATMVFYDYFWNLISLRMAIDHNICLLSTVLLLGETFFICWITLPTDLKIEIWKIKKWVWRQIGNKFPNIGILLFPWKNVMLLVCQILDICNYEVLFDQKMVTCKYYSSLENYGILQFISPCFLLRLPIWKFSLGVT